MIPAVSHEVFRRWKSNWSKHSCRMTQLSNTLHSYWYLKSCSLQLDFRTVEVVFFPISLQSGCQQDNTTANNLITTSSLAICMLETESRWGEGTGRKWWENRKQFGGKAGMDRETIAERWNCFQREGRCNNKHKGWRNNQKERRDMRADQSETQQITFTAIVPLQIYPHTTSIYCRSWSHHEFMSHIGHVLHADPELLRMIHFQSLESSKMCSVIQRAAERSHRASQLLCEVKSWTHVCTSAGQWPVKTSHHVGSTKTNNKRKMEDLWVEVCVWVQPSLICVDVSTSCYMYNLCWGVTQQVFRTGWSLCRVMDIHFMTEMLQWI